MTSLLEPFFLMAMAAAAMPSSADLFYLKPNNISMKPDRVSCTLATTALISPKRKLPVLLFDVMDTIVRDPFYHDVPAFFR